MESFGNQNANPSPLDPETKAIPPDDPSLVEPEEPPKPVRVPEGVSEADYLEQNLPA
ncbi:MAG: hypothetical protein WD178_05280 [Actinomycetota bacterium]